MPHTDLPIDNGASTMGTCARTGRLFQVLSVEVLNLRCVSTFVVETRSNFLNPFSVTCRSKLSRSQLPSSHSTTHCHDDVDQIGRVLMNGMDPEWDETLTRNPLPLSDKSVVVTGVSRRAGIGYATACRLAAYGASVFCHHFSPHDREQSWGGDDLHDVLDGVRAHLVGDARVADIHADFTDPAAPEQVIAAAAEEFGDLQALICNQALSGSDGALGELSATDLDRHWAIDARASILLAQAFTIRHKTGTPGSIVFMTSGQGLGPMPGEVAYAAAKAAIAGVTTTIADQLADRGIRVNTINPGPVDTGYMDDETCRMVEPMFPFGRFGRPDDPARLIAWLVTEEASWITGQTINTEGGFGRWRPRGQ